MSYKKRRIAGIICLVITAIGVILFNPESYETVYTPTDASASEDGTLATEILEKLEVKGRAPKTGYDREQFYDGWPDVDGCSLRQHIIKRDFGDSAVLGDDNCSVVSGEFDEPYTGSHLIFYQKSDISSGIQIDHVVALSDAWQKGAQQLTKDERFAIATDPLNLLAVDAKTNQNKKDGDAATWLPPNKAFRCTYVARQISVKYKYHLWITQTEKDMMRKVLGACPLEQAIGI
ncbi:HNH endonuclease [Candidatus Saccharibacteria bacterium]|nr:HNH endonuclease [Candidatus Saccharibacteria bacterium]